MNKIFLTLASGVLVLAAGQATAADPYADNWGSNKPITLAVMGDWPYNTLLMKNAPLLINSINSSSPKVNRVMHVGDIHAGSMPCTSYGILPTITKADPGWSLQVYHAFQAMNAPVVYTPGDNEWTDCQKTKQFSSGAPLNELNSVRTLFFARTGKTLGYNSEKVSTQGFDFDPAFPTDAQFVENVMWASHHIVFMTVNMPGSNNDTLPWAAPFSNPTAQAQENQQRTAADIRWMQQAFATAKRKNARAVVIGQQADMWDPEAAAPGGDGLSGYTNYVQALATEALAFGKPVLLINGDSHVYGSDQPLADPNSLTGKIHKTPAVTNLTRITVQGSTFAPAEWLRLTIDPKNAVMPFSWENVAYCKDPLTTCQ
jgi:hypothetical protein